MGNPEELEILGDGSQEKSYLYITDLIGAMMHLTERCFRRSGETAVYNVGSKDRITVKEIARMVAEEMGSPRIRFRFTGGVDGGRGWKGDVKNMQLSIREASWFWLETEVFEPEAVRAGRAGACAGTEEELAFLAAYSWNRTCG